MNVLRLRWLLLLGFAACGDSDIDTTRERGDLGRGKFLYECLGDTDPACATGSAAFPQAIAVGARFGMRFAIDSGAQPTVIAAASEFVEAVAGGFRALRAGDLALLAVNGNREVIDLKHVRSATIDEVRVRRDDGLPETGVALLPGESLELTAVPFDAQGVQLAGALDYTWSSDDPQVVRIDTLSDLNHIRLRALSEGKTTLSVTVAGETYALSVTSGEGTDFDAGAPETDAGEGDPTARDGGDEGDAALTDAGVDAGSKGGEA